MKANSDNMLDHLICSNHGQIRIVLYCIGCEKPICIDGLVESHNGHFVKKLSTAYEELVNHYEEQKDKIQIELLPKYTELGVNEDERKLEVLNSTDEIKNEIDSHIENVITMVKKIGTLAIGDLHIAGSEELQKFINFKSKINKEITKLNNLCKLMSANIEAKPEISFFKPIKSNALEGFQKLPTRPHHKSYEFQPGKINKLIQKELSDAVKSTEHRLEVELPIPKPNMTTPPVVPQPNNAKHDEETEGHAKPILTPASEAVLEHLFCSDHKTKKLECYCKHCEKPVCTDCIVESHNAHGHILKKLSTVYKERIDYFHHQIDKIQNDLIPKYEELRAIEHDNMSKMKTKNDDIERKIESHISGVIHVVKDIGAQSIEDLKNAKNEEINKIDNFKGNIDKEVNKLQHISDEISTCLGAQPNISFFKPIPKNNDLEKFQKLPVRPNYKVIEFHPEKINKLIHKELSEIVKTTENSTEIYKRTK